MNEIVLKGIIQDINESHESNGIQFNSARLLTKNSMGNDTSIELKFKKFSNNFEDGDYVELVGNVRSYSHNVDGRNKVDIYVFTYFDTPQINDDEVVNNYTITGRVCKRSESTRKLKDGKENFQFILANNIITYDSKLNSYLPCICWGKLAKEMANTVKISDKIKIQGDLRSHTYKKTLDNGEIEFRVAHELYVDSYEYVEDLNNEI